MLYDSIVNRARVRIARDKEDARAYCCYYLIRDVLSASGRVRPRRIFLSAPRHLRSTVPAAAAAIAIATAAAATSYRYAPQKAGERRSSRHRPATSARYYYFYTRGGAPASSSSSSSQPLAAAAAWDQRPRRQLRRRRRRYENIIAAGTRTRVCSERRFTRIFVDRRVLLLAVRNRQRCTTVVRNASPVSRLVLLVCTRQWRFDQIRIFVFHPRSIDFSI